jgi:hypothetical protein
VFTKDELDKVVEAARTGRVSIDFDWFDTVVEAASELGILGHEVTVDTVGPMEAFRLILTVNGVRFASSLLTFEDNWSEEYAQEPVNDSVLRLLIIAVREIKKIQTAQDTAKQVGP